MHASSSLHYVPMPFLRLSIASSPISSACVSKLTHSAVKWDVEFFSELSCPVRIHQYTTCMYNFYN